MTNNFVRAFVRNLAILCLLFLLLNSKVDAQISPQDTLSYHRPLWNGRDAVIHRPADSPYSLHHLARPFPAVQKPPPEVTSFCTFYTGMWIPTGRDRVLGSHPLLGVELGKWTDRFMWEINGEFQMGDTNTPYTVVNNNGVSTTSSLYEGTYLGLNFGYSLITIKRSVFYLTGGVGWTGFVAINGDDNTSQLSINTLTSNYGMGFQHFGKKGTLVGAALLFNYLNYQNTGGTPMDGNAVTFRLTIGVFN
jgi:hypothetical protein